MKRYIRKQYTLEELELLPKRESIHGNIKAYQDYWDYWEKPKHTEYAHWNTITRIVDKCIGKHTSFLVYKLKNNINYKKCYEFKSIADIFIKEALSTYNPVNDRVNVANIDGVLVYPYKQKVYVRPQEPTVYFKFIKFLKNRIDYLQCYIILNDAYYQATASYKHLTDMPFSKYCRLSDVKNLKLLSKDERLDLKDYLKENE